MKIAPITKLLLPLVALAILLGSCSDKTLRTYQANTPVYQSFEDFRKTEFKLESARALEHPGKIYIYGPYLFVNEYLKGVHFIDNSAPSSPVNLGFLPVLANVDMAVNNNTLYLDNYSDLIAIDISDIQNPRLVHRLEDVFNFSNYSLLGNYNPDYPMSQVHSEKGIVVDWTISEVTEEVINRNFHYYGSHAFVHDMSSFTTNSEASFIGGPGIGGSMARFTIWNDHLYVLEPTRLLAFGISGDPVELSEQSISWTGETIFPAQNHLFIGTPNGMLIYGLASPSFPNFISSYNHAQGCDPVVVAGDRAYVTVASGRECGGGTANVLDVINIEDFNIPWRLESYNMTHPKGLGIDGDLLFLCDGPDGLKIFDRTNDFAIDQNMIIRYPDITSSDVIPYNGNLIMTSAEGIYQYDYTNPNNIYQVSLIPVNP